MMKLRLVLALAVVSLAFPQKGCLDPQEVVAPSTKRALLVIIENNANVPEQLESLGETLGGIDVAGYTDLIGEAALEVAIKLVALPYYKRIVVLNNAEVSFKNIKAQLTALANENFTVDIVIDVHGGRTSNNYYLYLYDDESGSKSGLDDAALYPSEIEQLGSYSNINAVFQVSCYGSAFMNAWRKVGAKVVNGARDVNYYVVLTPLAFVEQWVEGKPFQEAVQSAYNAEKYMLDVIIGQRLGVGEDWMDATFFGDGCVIDTQGKPVCSVAQSSEMLISGNGNATIPQEN